ncbi:MAG: VCBS repeat-containing protein [bacterium]|nr:VCBS repeat-containing protein [bacterium]
MRILIFSMILLLQTGMVFAKMINPPVEIKVVPGDGGGNSFNVTWKPPAGEKIAAYFYKLDQQPMTNWTTKTSIKNLRVSGSGLHRLYLAASDNEGNVSAYQAVEFKLETKTPKGGKFTMTPPTAYQAGGSPGIIAVGDVSGDGLNDVVSANYYDNNISVFIQLPDGKLATQTTYPVNQGPFGVGIADMNCDGLNDVIVGCAAADTVHIFTQNEGGTLTQTMVFRSERGPYGLAVGDVNGDGRNDIVLSNSGAASISIFTWVPDIKESYDYLLGSFKGCDSLTMQKQGKDIFAHIVYAAGPTTYWLSIGDINGDFKEDIAAVNYSNSTLNVYFQQPDRALLSLGALQTAGGNPFNVCLGDINGDGLNEIVASGGPLSIFGRKDNISFGLIGTTTTKEGRSGAVRIGDVNDDGRADLINSNSETISVHLQDNNGKLHPPVHFSTGRGPGGLAIADVNNDGLNDIITGNISDNNITVLHPAWEK